MTASASFDGYCEEIPYDFPHHIRCRSVAEDVISVFSVRGFQDNSLSGISNKTSHSITRRESVLLLGLESSDYLHHSPVGL